MNLYKVEFKGYAYVKAENEEKAKCAFEFDEFACKKQSICNVTETSSLDMLRDIGKGFD